LKKQNMAQGSRHTVQGVDLFFHVLLSFKSARVLFPAACCDKIDLNIQLSYPAPWGGVGLFLGTSRRNHDEREPRTTSLYHHCRAKWSWKNHFCEGIPSELSGNSALPMTPPDMKYRV